MKQFAVFAMLLALAGCRAGGQVTSPPVFQCNAAGSYAPINPPTVNSSGQITAPASVTGTTFVWTPTPGTYCVLVQAVGLVTGSSPAIYKEGGSSNIVQVTIPSGDQATFAWTASAPTTQFPGPFTYILSSASASAITPPTAPTLAAPTVAVGAIDKPASADVLAMVATKLDVRVTRKR